VKRSLTKEIEGRGSQLAVVKDVSRVRERGRESESEEASGE
jgi:hypothetical protein